MAPSWMNISLLTFMLCLLILPLITVCTAADSKPSANDKKEPQTTSTCGPYGERHCCCAPAIPGIPGIPGSPGPAGSAGVPGSPGPQGPMGPRGDQGYDGKPGSHETKGSQGTKGDAGDIGSKGSPGPPGTASTSGSNWKQCVFKDLSDGKDTGLIKECIFNKISGETGLRVFWNGNLRLYNCHACCRRWYFTFDGAECSAPATIDGVVYMNSGTGGTKNLHRPRHIEGVCEKVHTGTVRVGFWVGNCAGYGTADAWTGWKSVSRMYVEEVPPPQA